MRYEFYCSVCKKQVKRKEVMPVVTKYENTPKGSPRKVIVKALHSNCRNLLQIRVFEKGKDVQNKLEENGC